MLEEEIKLAQRSVRTDAYQMSIGEVVNMYKDGELIINPDFQRLFRWEIGQKSRLIESLLLGIPLPSIFVFETEDSKWELVDGLQRISTILEFMGLLKEPSTDQLRSPSCLVGTKYLQSLKNVVWEKSDLINELPEGEQKELEKALQLAIRRARLSVEILKRPSDNNTKYDLFQRLNAGGTTANPQELRNCIVIMINKDYYTLMKEMTENGAFLATLNATEDQIEKQRHFEYISRFLVQTYIPYDRNLDVEEYIDEGIKQLAAQPQQREVKDCFIKTFTLLNSLYGENAFKRIRSGQHVGRFALAAFECIAIGIAKNIKHIEGKRDPEMFVRDRIEAFWQSTEIDDFFTPGLRGTTRIQRTVPFGERWFAV